MNSRILLLSSENYGKFENLGARNHNEFVKLFILFFALFLLHSSSFYDLMFSFVMIELSFEFIFSITLITMIWCWIMAFLNVNLTI